MASGLRYTYDLAKERGNSATCTDQSPLPPASKEVCKEWQLNKVPNRLHGVKTLGENKALVPELAEGRAEITEH